MNLHDICLWGPAFPSEPRSLPTASSSSSSSSCLEPHGGAGWAGARLLDRKLQQCRGSLGVNPWETWAGNAAGCECGTFRFHFSRGAWLGHSEVLTRRWLVPSWLCSPCSSPWLLCLCVGKTHGVCGLLMGCGLGSGTQCYNWFWREQCSISWNCRWGLQWDGGIQLDLAG